MIGIPVDSRICPYAPRCLIAIDDRHLDVHENEIGVFGFGHSNAAASSEGIVRAAQKVAQHAQQACLLLYNEDALAHGSLF
jgi:hypothetical protein